MYPVDTSVYCCQCCLTFVLCFQFARVGARPECVKCTAYDLMGPEIFENTQGCEQSIGPASGQIRRHESTYLVGKYKVW